MNNTMVNKQVKTHSQGLINSLICTDKGKAALRTQGQNLNIRERQFLRLLCNDDHISRNACLSILHKIPLQSLINLGLIAQINNHQECMDDLEQSIVMRSVDLPSPLLQVISGTYVS